MGVDPVDGRRVNAQRSANRARRDHRFTHEPTIAELCETEAVYIRAMDYLVADGVKEREACKSVCWRRLNRCIRLCRIATAIPAPCSFCFRPAAGARPFGPAPGMPARRCSDRGRCPGCPCTYDEWRPSAEILAPATVRAERLWPGVSIGITPLCRSMALLNNQDAISGSSLQ